MKKFFVLGFAAVLFASGVFLSCSNASGGSANGTTGTESTGGGGTAQTESTGPTAAENAKVIADAIKAMTESGTVKATGKLDASSIRGD
ncbi:MAG: hypothetical protein IK015_10860 [Treponema sp.]|nr:hypothetical protein [Treponema sp.]